MVAQDVKHVVQDSRSTNRTPVEIDIEDIGAADLDLCRSPDPSMKWRLKQWVELADKYGRHAASAQVQLPPTQLPWPPHWEIASLTTERSELRSQNRRNRRIGWMD